MDKNSAFKALLVTWLASHSIPVFAQTQLGRIIGRVTDASEAVVPDATVSASFPLTGATFATKSNGEGYYVIPNLQYGRYSVTVTKPGFASYKVADGVVRHKAIGLGVYSVFSNDITEQNAIEAPAGGGIAMNHMVTVSLASGRISNIINDSGGSVGNGQFSRSTTY